VFARHVELRSTLTEVQVCRGGFYLPLDRCVIFGGVVYHSNWEVQLRLEMIEAIAKVVAACLVVIATLNLLFDLNERILKLFEIREKFRSDLKVRRWAVGLVYMAVLVVVAVATAVLMSLPQKAKSGSPAPVASTDSMLNSTGLAQGSPARSLQPGGALGTKHTGAGPVETGSGSGTDVESTLRDPFPVAPVRTFVEPRTEAPDHNPLAEAYRLAELGHTYMGRGEYVEARASFQRALAQVPNTMADAEAVKLRGNLTQEIRNTSTACNAERRTDCP
jgi:tetratricopeptide (TPR) repeat protein